LFPQVDTIFDSFDQYALNKRRSANIFQGEPVMKKHKPFKLLYIMITAMMCLLVTGRFSGTSGNDAVAGEPAPFLVQAADMDTAMTAVHAVGGQITHELALIDAVGAQLTPRQQQILLKDPDLTALIPDAAVTIVSAGAQTVRDEFDAGSYAGNNGSVNWAGDWVEFGESDGPASGRIRVAPKPNCNDGNCMQMGGYYALNNKGVQRAVNLEGATSAEVSFTYKRRSYDGGGIFFQVSPDGQQWVTLEEYSFNHVDPSQLAANFDISPYATAGTQIRFIFGPGEIEGYMYIDDVTITYSGDAAAIPSMAHTKAVQAHILHDYKGITGQGIGVAIIDTGFPAMEAITVKADGQPRDLKQYDAITDYEYPDNTFGADDASGHGSHIAGIIAGSDEDNDGISAGIAPNADLISIKAFDVDGRGSYLDIIRAIDWAVANKDAYNIRVLNLSFSATPQSYYWDDPINQAVMQAWQAGIVVVAAAGNTGPDPMTIGVPGNVPYIITVGAASDNYTPDDMTDDYLTSFSAAGPTVEGFVKPDLVAPGGHIQAVMPRDAKIGLDNPQYFDADTDYFEMSGTSQATAVVSGVVAQMLEADPPDPG
jgi:subtilisin family serine protease